MSKKERRYVEFTKQMKETHTILMPNMCRIHFEILRNIFEINGFKTELLSTTGRAIVDEGLKYVHNDTCYPALLSIGQLMDALHSGRYDLSRTALIMSQTGGGCRASNYIHLLRKALKADGLGHIPVISLSATGMEQHSGFKMSFTMLRQALAAIIYGDMLMLLSNQCKPYVTDPGSADRLAGGWIEQIKMMFLRRKGYSKRELKKNLAAIAESFAALPREQKDAIKVGIVGEIYVKYSPLANNDLENFLASQGCEIMVPGLLGFILYCTDSLVTDIDLYGGSRLSRAIGVLINKFLRSYEDLLIFTVEKQGVFKAPWRHERLHQEGGRVISPGCKMGEGWLLTAEMVELIEHGYSNIICTQPFGCLPNHIVGKGMIRRLRSMYKAANIVAIDYDPGATQVNQENRIKLMLSVACE